MKGILIFIAWLVILGGFCLAGFCCLVFLAPMSQVNSSGTSGLGSYIAFGLIVSGIGFMIRLGWKKL